MTRYVIDAPALLRIVAEGVEVGPGNQILAPSRIRSDALSLLFDAARDGDLTEATALRHLERMTALKMRLLGDRVSRRTAWRIAHDQGWTSTHDAEYVAITVLQADALVAVDAALADRAKGLVPLAPFRALITSGHAGA